MNAPPTIHHDARPICFQRGLSLVEFMISITIGLIILATMSTMFVNQSRTRAELDKANRLIDNGRYALEVLSENLRLAGFYGELEPNGTALPTALPDPCATTASDIQSAIRLHVQGINNANNTNKPSCVASIQDGTDILVVRRAETTTPTAVSAVTGNTTRYLQVSLCPLDTQTFRLDNNPANFSLRKKGCTSTSSNLADLRRFLVHIYFIDQNNNPGDGIPTLKRAELSTAGTFTTTPLVEGVQNMQIEYGLDTTGNDGVADSFTNCSACSISDWANVVAVRVHLLTRNLETTTGFTDTKSYTLGDVPAGPFNDAYRRHAYSQFVRLINPAGRKETP